jgi:8-oxo-dGTP pyrophosphatase MutT (NUDIX family)
VNKDDKPSAPAPAHPAESRDAATVVVLRDSSMKGVEVYLIKRSRMMDFMACAVRETFEEAGLQFDPAALVPWVRWFTPEISPRRFDALLAYASVAEDALGGKILRLQLETGCYRPVSAGLPGLK